MVVKVSFNEFLEIQEASRESEALASFKRFMDRPKMINELDSIYVELSNYGFHRETLLPSEPDNLLFEIEELARQLESSGHRLGIFTDAFKWLHYKGIDAMRKNSTPVHITRRDGSVTEGLWCLKKGAHGTGVDIVYLFSGDAFDINIVPKGCSENQRELRVKEALCELAEEQEMAA
jgi:hypothetical protein